MSLLSEIQFELTVPNPTKFKPVYMKPVHNSFLVREILKEIDEIVRNTDHEQVYQHTEVLMKFKRVKCWSFLLLTICVLIAAVWAVYIFYLCNVITTASNSCDYSNYTNNTINQTCWAAFLFLSVTTLGIIIYANYSFNNKSKTISQQWITSIKQEIQLNITERRQKSPQHSFELNYQTAYQSRTNSTHGILTVRKRIGTGTTPISSHEHKETHAFDTYAQKKNAKQRVKIEHIHIGSNSNGNGSQELAYVTQITPVEESGTGHMHGHRPQISMEMLSAYADHNTAMINQLNYNLNVNPQQPQGQLPYASNINGVNPMQIQPQMQQNINQMQISGGSQSNLNENYGVNPMQIQPQMQPQMQIGGGSQSNLNENYGVNPMQMAASGSQSNFNVNFIVSPMQIPPQMQMGGSFQSNLDLQYGVGSHSNLNQDRNVNVNAPNSMMVNHPSYSNPNPNPNPNPNQNQNRVSGNALHLTANPNEIEASPNSQENPYGKNQYDYGAGDYGQNAQYNDFV